MTVDVSLDSRQTLGDQIWVGWLLFCRIMQMRTRRALLGYIWIVAPLVLFVAAASFIVNQLGVGESLSQDIPYPIFLLSGMVMWNAFTDGGRLTLFVARRAVAYLRFQSISVVSIVFASFFYTGLFVVIKFFVLLAVLSFSGALVIDSPAQLPLIIGVIVTMASIGCAIGLVFAPLSYILMDFRYVLPYLFGVLMIFTPILYRPPDGLLGTIMWLNPFTWVIETGRSILLEGFDVSQVLPVACGALFAALCLYVATRLHHFVVLRAVLFM